MTQLPLGTSQCHASRGRTSDGGIINASTQTYKVLSEKLDAEATTSAKGVVREGFKESMVLEKG